MSSSERMISHLSTEAEGLRNLSRIGTYFFLVMMAAAILLIRPGLYTDVIGLSAFGLVFLWQRIKLETYFPSYGIGLPHQACPDRESGQLVLKGINEPREISFFTLSINDYKLILREYEVLLSPPERDGHIIEILARKRAGIVWMVENLKTRLAIAN